MSGAGAKRLILVVGVGRSGTSLLTGILGQLGCHIPTPEVQANDTNPRGFGEPRWVVDFHTALLRKRRVTVNDARPVAFERMASGPEIEAGDAELRNWLGPQLEQAETVVVKDPRTVWFLPLWTRTAQELGVATSFVTMLRHPAEILASATKSYGTWQSENSRAAAWLNVMLETEHATRGARRAFVRYEDLLADWAPQISRMGRLIDVPALAAVDRASFPAVDEFVDPTLHRNRVHWEDLDVAARVRDMAEDVWQTFQPLAAGAQEPPETGARLDAARAAYVELYAEAESIAQTSAHAVRPRRRQAPAPEPAPPPSLRVRIARLLPPRYRRRIRRALGRLRTGGAAGPRS
jgi:hypothetical protein